MTTKEHYPFQLEPLPYAYNSLEPYIDTLTMQIHHDRHVQTYVDNLNAVLKNYPEYHKWSLEQLITQVNWLPEEIRVPIKNNGGGVYNHNFFFKNMKNATAKTEETMETTEQNHISEALSNAIDEAFGDFNKFKNAFTKAALGVFGSGYAWLASNNTGKLKITTSANQDTLLTRGLCAIMCIDVWEHAYYLKHYNKRIDYINDWFNVVDLDQASKNYVT